MLVFVEASLKNRELEFTRKKKKELTDEKATGAIDQRNPNENAGSIDKTRSLYEGAVLDFNTPSAS